MREAALLFVWMLALVVAAALMAMVAMEIFDHVFVPQPYHDPEPPFTTPPGS
jgi:hypothetical protein